MIVIFSTCQKEGSWREGFQLLLSQFPQVSLNSTLASPLHSPKYKYLEDWRVFTLTRIFPYFEEFFNLEYPHVFWGLHTSQSFSSQSQFSLLNQFGKLARLTDYKFDKYFFWHNILEFNKIHCTIQYFESQNWTNSLIEMWISWQIHEKHIKTL